MKQRYNFDVTPLPSKPTPAPVPEKESTLIQPAIPAGPRPSLLQTLLSEASIKTYLYLGAFFVIAAALILAAVVDAARLPILGITTLAFGGGAFVIRKRLPQPSFALFIVFSFLLLIDANALEETLALSGAVLDIYWTIIFLFMTFIWSFSVWLYESRLFSMVAFVTLGLACTRAASIFKAETEGYVFMVLLASFAGLAGTYILKKWKDQKFSLPLFGLAQLQTAVLLLFSALTCIGRALENGFPNGWWLLISLTWVAAASFYTLSHLTIPFLFFPWMAVAALLPIPWLFLNVFEPTLNIFSVGFWIWATALAGGSEVARRATLEKIKPYSLPLLLGSSIPFLVSYGTALDNEILLFATLAGTTIIYSALNFLNVRWFVWSAALLAGLFAYFVLFNPPFIDGLNIPVAYQILGASILLLAPEILMKSPLTFRSQWRLPAFVLGCFVALLSLTVALVDFQNMGRSAIAFLVYAILFTLYAFHFKRVWLRYFAAAAETLAVIYALRHFNIDIWLPLLTAQTALYYAAGFFLRRGDKAKVWGNVLTNSGLILGVLLSSTVLFLSKESGGWYIIIIALVFTVEMFSRPLAWLEVIVEVLLSFSLYRILQDFNISSPIQHFLFGVSLIWLGGDLFFSRFVKEKRALKLITVSVGYLFLVASAFGLWSVSNPSTPAIYFTVYALFFLLYSISQREPRLGYFATGFIPLGVVKLCNMFKFERWIFPLIALAVLYYTAGFLLRQIRKKGDWDTVLLFSGLGLGVITSFNAPFEGGLSVSIPVAIAATLFAVEAFARRSAWWALPANALYLMSYFMILAELNVDEPQYYSISAALLGMLMHYLLTRAGSKTGAFIMGMLSQVVLLGTTYIQMVSANKISFFFVLFVQSMVVLIYGLIQRSRSLVITPIVFAVLGVVTVVYSALKGLSTVILIGCTGVLLLLAGIVAVILRERITKLGERFSDWNV